jgi:hypothetical protein
MTATIHRRCVRTRRLCACTEAQNNRESPRNLETGGRYRFVQYDERNRALRYLVGFGAGKGTMTAEVTFPDKSGAELGKVAVAGEIIMGFFGGDFDAAISAAAKKIADYTIKTF